MLYRSTRNSNSRYSAAEVILQGLAPDGGLFTPVEIPLFTQWESLLELSYSGRAAALMQPYLDGFSEEEINAFCTAAYDSGRFDHPSVAPLRRLTKSLFFLELWHGPTCAFKDMALQILPHLMRGAAAKNRDTAQRLILTATSGDTGKAALEGFRDIPGTRIVVFYPVDGVSEIQKKQMVTQEGSNVHVIAIRGNFDAAQSGVKEIFADGELAAALAARGYKFSSANSINWGRLVPQIAYYFSAYLDLVREREIRAGEPVDFVVPTGNFGNILAGFYARQMGLPLRKLICASNENNVLTDFINSG
ncbi:MAG TPA: threonine synthase, partial [Bacillota bacterium]|nr:threonine synthase [Bacillota bacterium]